MTGLPTGWATITIGEASGVGGLSTDGDWIESKDQDPTGSVRLIQLQDIGDGMFVNKSSRFLTEDKAEELNCTFLSPGDVLIARMPDPLGRACRFPDIGQKSVTAVDVHVWRRGEHGVEPDFLVYCVNSPEIRQSLQAQASGTTRQRVSGGRLKAQEIPFPPLPEQRRIVRKLDTLSARSTTARTHLTAIERLVERMRGAVLSQALNGRLVASQLDCGEPLELGRFIIGIEQGWSPKCDNEPELDPTKWAVLTTTAIQAITFDSTENKRLPESLSPRPHLEVEAGDVLMTRAGPRVRCAVCCYVAETAPRRIFSDKVYRIRLDQSVEPEFFVMMMNAPEMVRALDAIKSGGSESGLNLTQDRLKSLAINVWDRPTQVEVIADIKRQFTKIDRLAAEAEKALKLLGHLDQRILAKAFAGDLVPQDPNDEPADSLLARIREARAAAPTVKRRRAAIAGRPS